MHIKDFLCREMVVDDSSPSSKEGMLHILANQLCLHKAVQASSGVIFNSLNNRERLGSTGVGDGVAIPHAKIPGVTSLAACFGRVPQGVPFDSIDKAHATLIFALLVPEDSAGTHLKALARISRLLKDPLFRETLLQCQGPLALYETFIAADD